MSGSLASPYSSLQGALQTLVNLNLMPADAAAVIANWYNPSTYDPNLPPPSGYDILGGGANFLKIGVTVIESLGRELPGIGNDISLASLVNNAAKLTDEYETRGIVTLGTFSGLASDAVALAGVGSSCIGYNFGACRHQLGSRGGTCVCGPYAHLD